MHSTVHSTQYNVLNGKIQQTKIFWTTYIYKNQVPKQTHFGARICGI